MKRYSQYIMYALFLLFGLGCDEGKIYPDETVDSGRTATVSLSFTGLKAWPKENMLSLCAFGEDKSKPLQTQRISKPAEDGKRLKLRLNNVTPDTRSIGDCGWFTPIIRLRWMIRTNRLICLSANWI